MQVRYWALMSVMPLIGVGTANAQVESGVMTVTGAEMH